MAISVYDTIQKGRQLRAQTQQQEQQVLQGEFAYVDTLYETNPQAGMDYAKKIGLLPQGSTLTSVSVNGVDTPAASIPGLPKPIILPSAGRTTQRASAASQTLETQKAAAKAEQDANREAARNSRLKYTQESKRETDLLVEKVKQAGRMTEQLQRAEDEMNLAREKAKLDFTSDDAQREHDIKKQEYEYLLKSVLSTQEAEQDLVKVEKQGDNQKEVAGIQGETSKAVAGINQGGATFRNERNIQTKKEMQATDNSAKASRQVRAGEQKIAQIAAQGGETRKTNSEKPVSQGNQRLSVAPVTPDQELNTWRALGPAMKESGYGGSWMDAPDHVKSGVNAIAEAANTIAGAYKKAGVVKSNTQITRQIAAELKNPESPLWITDGDTGEKTINIDALAEMAQGEIDQVTYGKDVANFRAKDPKYSKNLTDAEIAALIKKHKGE